MVRVLWEAWQNGTPDVGQDYLIEQADAASGRLADVFKGSPAWKTLVVPGESRGAYRLAEPQ